MASVLIKSGVRTGTRVRITRTPGTYSCFWTFQHDTHISLRCKGFLFFWRSIQGSESRMASRTGCHVTLHSRRCNEAKEWGIKYLGIAMQSVTLGSRRPARQWVWLGGLKQRISSGWAALTEFLAPAPTLQEVRRLEIEKRVREDLRFLLERARSRSYPETMNVLVFYWVMTIREGYTEDHWRILKIEVQRLRGPQSSLAYRETRALEQAAEWIAATGPLKRRNAHRNLASPFTSGQLTPPGFVSQAFLEMLFHDWLPERILKKYGRQVVSGDWESENWYEEIALCLEEILRPQVMFPDVETVRAMEKLQKRRPAPMENILEWRRRRQAGLESLVTVPLQDAGAIDPKQREILNDVILYLLGVTSPAPAIAPGYAWFFPAPIGESLPADAAAQVSEYPLPPEYASGSTLFVPFKKWAGLPQPGDRLKPLSIHSALLTPDGRVWEAHHLEQAAGAAPGVVYRAAGKIDVKATAQGFLLRVPIVSWPEEISAQFSQQHDLELYGGRWHMKQFEVTLTGASILYRRASQPNASASSKPSSREESTSGWAKAS